MLIRLSAPDGPFVTLSDMKDALRVTTDADDGRIASLTEAETARYEGFTGRVLRPVDLEYRLGGWWNYVEIPVHPIREVTSVSYIAADDADATLDAWDWTADQMGSSWLLYFSSGFSRPDLSDRPDPVRVRFSAGYDLPGDSGTAELAPRAADREAIILMVARIYDEGTAMTEGEMRQVFGHRRIFR